MSATTPKASPPSLSSVEGMKAIPANNGTPVPAKFQSVLRLSDKVLAFCWVEFRNTEEVVADETGPAGDKNGHDCRPERLKNATYQGIA